MPKVQIRDASNPEKILLTTTLLPFVPELNKPVYIRTRARDTNSKGYLITGVIQYEIVVEDPDESGIVLAGRPIQD